ncbi:hypothetical protein [Zobellia nedashkovskayae]|uniref:hypothetical protein n=1 Tax=Zobellia nedashkovskayae TaxID=2779510 RepID=UPI00188BE4FE|nr:hypothetical protein [Zobellia nedashkovskayae]
MEKNFSITVVNNKKKVLFLTDSAISLIVNENQKKLLPVPSPEKHLGKLKEVLGEVWLDEAFSLPTQFRNRSYHITNNFILSAAKLTGEVSICSDDRLLATVNEVQNSSELKNQLFDLSLASNEILSHLKTEIEINGQKIISEMEVTSIEEVIMPEAYYQFLNYTFTSEAA